MPVKYYNKQCLLQDGPYNFKTIFKHLLPLQSMVVNSRGDIYIAKQPTSEKSTIYTLVYFNLIELTI